MLKKIVPLTLLIIFLYGCGFQPIYSNMDDSEINIKIINIEGDRETNNIIKLRLNKYQKDNAIRNFEVEIKTEFNKKSILKDAAGNTTNYRLSSSVNFTVKLNEEDKVITLSEKFDIKKSDTKFEEKNYEKTIKKNMADLIVRRFVNQILMLK